MPKQLLVTGATGKQGGSVITSLLSSPAASDYQILAVTRDPSSASAKSLASKSTAIKLLQGNLDDVPALFRSASEITKEPIWGVYSVQVPMGKGQNPDSEEKQGKALVDESVKQGVKMFVYSSVDRGGDEKSWNNPTDVPHFISKHRIEHHLREQAGSAMGWTILRPVAFMDNFTPAFQTKVFLAALKVAMGNKSLQYIATSDIGYFGAQAFMKPEEYRGKAIGLAGDELTYDQLDATFRKVTGSPAPATYGFMGSALLWGVKELNLMINFFKTEGYGVDIAKTKKMYPGLIDFESWLGQKSGWAKK